jgi:hypothetical protein
MSVVESNAWCGRELRVKWKNGKEAGSGMLVANGMAVLVELVR